MIENQSIVCFAPDPWKDLWRNRHRLLSIFARKNRVLYVEPRTRIRHLIGGLRSRKIPLARFLAPRVEEVRPDLFVYHDPLHLPRIAWRGIGPTIDRLRFSLLRRTLRRLRIERPILWLVRPESWDVPGRLGESMLLYQVVDDYLTYSGLSELARARIDREERSLGARADLVVVTSEHLLETKSHLNENIVLVRNGVDERTLDEGEKGEGTPPPDLAAARRPILGYIGGVTEKLDLELLERLADGRRGTLVLVGSINVHSEGGIRRIERLRASPHAIFTGRKDPSEVPDYVRAFDVCLVPYRLGPQARAIDPLKLYEYLAFGKPTVSASIPSVQRFAEVLRIARDPEDFLRQVEAAAEEKDPELAGWRRALARENSWERRADQIAGAVEDALRRKSRTPPVTAGPSVRPTAASAGHAIE